MNKIKAEADNFRRMREEGTVTITQEHFTKTGDYLKTSFTKPGGSYMFGPRPLQYEDDREELERYREKRELKNRRTMFDCPLPEDNPDG